MATNGEDLKNIKQLGSLYLHQNWLQKRLRLCKTTEYSSLWVPWEKLSGQWRVFLAIHGLPVGTAKKEKRSHGQASSGTGCSGPPMAGPGRGLPDPLLRLPMKDGSQSCQHRICNSLYKCSYKAGLIFNNSWLSVL